MTSTCFAKHAMPFSSGNTTKPEAPLPNLDVDEFLSRCGMSHAKSNDLVIGEFEAMLMVSNFRDLEIDEIEETDDAVRFLQGKRMRTIRRSLTGKSKKHLLPMMNQLMASGSSEPPSREQSPCASETTSPRIPSADTPFPRQNRVSSADAFMARSHTARDDFDAANMEADDERDEEETDSDYFSRVGQHRSFESQASFTFEFAGTGFCSVDTGHSEVSLDDDSLYGSDTENSAGPSCYITFGYMSPCSDSDDETLVRHKKRTVTASQSGINRSVSNRTPRLQPHASGNHLIVPFGMRKKNTTAPFTKSSSAHVGKVSEDMLFARLGVMHSVDMGAPGIEDMRTDSLMSNTSYVLYDLEDTPPPPDCSIMPELYVQSRFAARR